MFLFFNSFKTKLSEVLTRYSDLKDLAKEKIVQQAEAKLAGYEKKEVVDKFIIAELNKLALKYGSNIILKFIIDWFIDKVPETTQKIYDNLKAKISGITAE